MEVRELSPGPYKLPFALDCRFLVHASPCLGYRFDLDGKIITYCPDTGVCENAVLLAEDADLLIAECAHLPGEKNPAWPHLNPQDAADIARQAKAKRLASPTSMREGTRAFRRGWMRSQGSRISQRSLRVMTAWSCNCSRRGRHIKINIINEPI